MRGVSCSGGGVLGSFEVGALHTLIHSGRTYDMFSGVSVGAINASFLAQYQNQKAAIDKLVEFWLSIDTSSVYKHWNCLMYLNALWKPSIYDTSPLRKLINTHIDPNNIIAAGKRAFIGAASVTSEEYRVWNETSSNYIDAIMASSAFPAFLTPVLIDGQLWADGGIKDTHNISSLIKAGCDEIDIISCVPVQRFTDNLTSMKTAEVTLRALDVLTDEIAYRDLRMAAMWNKLIELGYETNKRKIKINILQPKTPLEGSALNFDPTVIRNLIAFGKDSIINMRELTL